MGSRHSLTIHQVVFFRQAFVFFLVLIKGGTNLNVGMLWPIQAISVISVTEFIFWDLCVSLFVFVSGFNERRNKS